MNKEIKEALIWAVIMLSLAVIDRYAYAHGYIDADTKLRIIAMNGLWMIYYGNRMPKRVVPHACARQVTRLAGWSMVLSGLVYAGLWVFAPVHLAAMVGTGAVVAGIALTLGYCIWLKARGHAGA